MKIWHLNVCVCSIFSFKHVWLNNADILCLPILSLICSSFRMGCLTLGFNECRKVPYVFQVLTAPTRSIFRGANNEMTYTIKSCRKNKWKENLRKKRILLAVRGRIGGKRAIGISECDCHIRSWYCLRKVC